MGAGGEGERAWAGSCNPCPGKEGLCGLCGRGVVWAEEREIPGACEALRASPFLLVSLPPALAWPWEEPGGAGPSSSGSWGHNRHRLISCICSSFLALEPMTDDPSATISSLAVQNILILRAVERRRNSTFGKHTVYTQFHKAWQRMPSWLGSCWWC